MKKALFLLLLLPFIGFSQNPLVKWHGLGVQPQPWVITTQPSYFDGSENSITAANINGTGINFNYNAYNGFQGTGWSTNTTGPDLFKYFYLEVTPKLGKQINITQLSLTYKGNCKKMRISYVKSTSTATGADFPFTGATSMDLSNLVYNNNDTFASFTLTGANTTIVYGEKLQIRIYGYESTDSNQIWMLRDNPGSSANASGNGPAIYGTISNYSANTYSTVADAASTFVTQPVFINVLSNDTAGTTAATTINISTQATNGTAAQATVNGILGVTYIPNNSYAGGTDSFYYTVTNGNGTSTAAKVTVTVNPFVAPTANADTASVTENGSVIVSVLGNDTYGTSTTYSSVSVTTQPAHGTATVNTTANPITVTYAPNQWYFATGDSFAYTVTDSNGKTSNAATVTVGITALASPTVSSYTKTTGQNIAVSTNVLAGATAGSGTITGVSIVGTPSNGTATVDSNNNVIYTPATNFTGTGVVTYKVSNSNQKSTNGTITVNVDPIVAASATADAYTIAKNTSTELSVMANDNIGNSALTSIVVVSAPAHGTATITNTNKITYVPVPGYTGTDSFSYKITNAYNTNATAIVSLTVVEPSPTGALVGTFTVGTGGHFATITAAVNHLNQYGVSGNVVFSLINSSASKVYNQTNGEVFPITINTFTNPNNYTVTFKPATGKNVKVDALRPYVASGSGNGDSWAVPSLFKLYGADNIIFDGSNTANGTTRNLVLVNSSYAGSLIRTSDADGNNNSNDYTDRAVVWLAPNGSDDVKNITIKYVQIKQAYKNSSDNYCMGIFGGSSNTFDSNEVTHDSASAALKNINITGNDFVNVKEGIYLNGGTSDISNNITIFDNDLGSENNQESVILPISINNINTFTISQNYIYKLYRTTTAADLASGGINVTGVSRNGDIYKNDLKDLKRPTENDKIFAGIILASSYANSNIKVYNNFVLDVSAKGNGGGYSNGYGIVVDQGSGYKIYNNTVVLTAASNQSNGGYSAAFYVNEGVTGLDVRNNIFVNGQTQTTTRRTAISVKNTAANVNSVFTFLDYNDYYSTDRLAYIAVSGNTGNITWPGTPGNENSDYLWTLDAWKSAVNSVASGKEAHSKNVNPSFASATDLHINAYAAANNGIVDAGTNAILSIVPKDIDGQIRKTDTPDMGADEFGPVAMPTPGSNTGIFCDSSTTWNGTSWSNGDPSSTKDVIFNANYTQTGGTFNACSVYVLAGKSVNFISNSTATVVHSVNIADTGALTFESGSHLVQVEDDQNSGIATVKRKSGLLKRLDYTMWCAPVVDPREGVTGTSTNYQSLQEFSPATISNRFYYYNTATDLYADYTNPAATKFAKGRSVLIRMPDVIPGNTAYTAGTTRVQFEGIFEGTPTTGTQRIALDYSNGKGFNSVGNPYPSPINIAAFIQENSLNSGVISGTIWLWRKTNNSSLSSYATCTIEGYVNNLAINPDGSGNNEGNTAIQNPFDLTGGIDGGGLLNTGQGFIVKAMAANKDLIFKNNMRDGSVHSNSFFKTNNSGAGTTEANQDGRFWLNVKGSDTFSQSLISYHDYTTDGYDNGYDGTVIISGNLNLYSVLPVEDETVRLAIQAKSMFTDNDVVPLGFVASAAGTYTFEIDHTEGLFSQGQQIYVKDNMLGVTHNLSDGGFDFTTDAGTFNSRFEVVYQPQGELGTDLPTVDAKEVIVYRDGKQIKATSSEVISSVTVFDMLGRTLYTKNNIDATEFSTSELNTAQQVVIVNITLDNQQVVSKKIMMN